MSKEGVAQAACRKMFPAVESRIKESASDPNDEQRLFIIAAAQSLVRRAKELNTESPIESVTKVFFDLENTASRKPDVYTNELIALITPEYERLKSIVELVVANAFENIHSAFLSYKSQRIHFPPFSVWLETHALHPSERKALKHIYLDPENDLMERLFNDKALIQLGWVEEGELHE